jgi:hypothetical protein
MNWFFWWKCLDCLDWNWVFLVFRAKISLQSYFAKFTCPVSQINFAKSWSSPCYHSGISSRCLYTFAKLQSPHYHICLPSLQFHNVIWLFCQIAKSTQCLNCPLPEFLLANSKLYSREILPYTSKASHKIHNRDGCMLNNAKALAVHLEEAQSQLCNNLGGNLLCSLIDLTQLEFLSPSWHRYMEYQKVNLCWRRIG